MAPSVGSPVPNSGTQQSSSRSLGAHSRRVARLMPRSAAMLLHVVPGMDSYRATAAALTRRSSPLSPSAVFSLRPDQVDPVSACPPLRGRPPAGPGGLPGWQHHSGVDEPLTAGLRKIFAHRCCKPQKRCSPGGREGVKAYNSASPESGYRSGHGAASLSM